MQPQEKYKQDKSGQQQPQHPESSSDQQNDDYKRDGVHLGDSYQTGASMQKGGGGSGYDVSREQQEVNKQQQEMHQERSEDDLQIERTQTPRPEIDPGRESPGQSPEPETRPGTSTMGSAGRNVNGAWSQSSWDPNNIR